MKEEDKRNHKINSDYGLSDYYRFYKKKYKNKKVNRLVYNSMINEFNKYVRDRISYKGDGYVFPFKMGKMELRKVKTVVKISEDGTIVNKLPVNWKDTKELWKESPAAKENQIKVRYTNEHTGGYAFRISYLRARANYKNKSIYQMQFNRQLKRTLSESIFAGKIDAFLK
jgi:hypothetical protein